MNNPAEALRVYRDKGLLLLIDTNLLLLFFVGLQSRQDIARFKRTNAFTPHDFEFLAGVISSFKLVVTTPSILTEVSNLLGQFHYWNRNIIFEGFAKAIQRFQEEFIPSRELANEPFFPKFGLTDTGIIQSARGKFLVLTDDFELAGYLESQAIAVSNFNQLRMTYMFDPGTGHRSRRSAEPR